MAKKTVKKPKTKNGRECEDDMEDDEKTPPPKKRGTKPGEKRGAYRRKVE